MIQHYQRLTGDEITHTRSPVRLEVVGSRIAAIGSGQPPFFLDFDAPQALARMRDAARTSILKKLVPLLEPARKIVDASVGFAQDAREFSQLGIEVFGQERNPMVFALTLDAFLSQLGMTADGKAEWLSNQGGSWIEVPRRAGVDAGGRIHLRYSRSLEGCSELARVAYFDPMFSEEGRAALPKKNIQFLLNVVGHDSDQEHVFRALLGAGFSGIVVKRQAGAPTIVSEPHPERQYQSKLVRLDVYRCASTAKN